MKHFALQHAKPRGRAECAGGAGHQPGEPAQPARAHAPQLVLVPRAQALAPAALAGPAFGHMRRRCCGPFGVQLQIMQPFCACTSPLCREVHLPSTRALLQWGNWRKCDLLRKPSGTCAHLHANALHGTQIGSLSEWQALRGAAAQSVVLPWALQSAAAGHACTPCVLNLVGQFQHVLGFYQSSVAAQAFCEHCCGQTCSDLAAHRHRRAHCMCGPALLWRAPRLARFSFRGSKLCLDCMGIHSGLCRRCPLAPLRYMSAPCGLYNTHFGLTHVDQCMTKGHPCVPRRLAIGD